MTTEWKFPLLMMKMVVHSGRHLLLALRYRLRHCMPVKPLTESIPLILCQSTCRRLKKEAIFALKKGTDDKTSGEDPIQCEIVENIFDNLTNVFQALK